MINSTDQLIIPPSKKKRLVAVTCILLAYLFETICFNCLQSVLFDFLVMEYHWSVESSVRIYNTLALIIGFMAGLGAILSDFILNRFLLIILSYMCYSFGIIGLLLLQLNSTEQMHPSVPVLCQFNSTKSLHGSPNCYSFVMMMIILIGLGTGVARLILMVIAADQVRCYGARSVSIIILSMYSVEAIGMFLVHLCLPMFNWHIKQATVIVFLLFLSGTLMISGAFIVMSRPFLEMRRSKLSPLSLFKTLQNMYKCYKEKYKADAFPVQNDLFERTKSYLNWQFDDHVDTLKFYSYAFLVFLTILPLSMVHGLEVLRVIQSLHMKIPRTKYHSFKNWTAPSEFFLIVINVTIICVSLKRLSRNEVFNYLPRILVGTSAAILAVFYDGIIESVRLRVFWGSNNPTTTPLGSIIHHRTDIQEYTSANMSVFFLIPSEFLIALANALVMVTCMEYMYLTIPPWLQASAMSLVFISWSWGDILDIPFYQLDGIVFNFSDISYRRPCSNFNSTSMIDIDIPACWSSRLDSLFYIFASIVIVLFVLLITPMIKWMPNLFHRSYMGLEERLLDVNDDEPDQIDSEDDY